MNACTLEGLDLDEAVAKILGLTYRRLPAGVVALPSRHAHVVDPHLSWFVPFSPSSMSSEADPIIESEKIATVWMQDSWSAFFPSGHNGGYYGGLFIDMDADGEGPTPRIAAMRAFVAVKGAQQPHRMGGFSEAIPEGSGEAVPAALQAHEMKKIK